MIEAQPIGPDGHPVGCPECRKALYTVYPHEQVLDGPVPYSDGDIIPLDNDLTPSQRDGFGWYAMLQVGACGHCDASLLLFRVCIMDAEPSSDVENAFFHHNAECGIPHSFHARREGGEQSWIVTRWDTPQGPMLEHEFGPYPFGEGRLVME